MKKKYVPVRISTYRYILFDPFSYYGTSGILTTWTRIGKTVHMCLNMVQTCMYMITMLHASMTMYVHVMYMYIHLNMVCNMYRHGHEFLYLYVHCIYTYIDVNTCLDSVLTLLCSFTTTLHFPSGPISLVTPASLSSAQEPLLLSSLLPGTSLFN